MLKLQVVFLAEAQASAHINLILHNCSSFRVCFTPNPPAIPSVRQKQDLLVFPMSPWCPWMTKKWKAELSCSTPKSFSVCPNLSSIDLSYYFFTLPCFDPQLWSLDWEVSECSFPKLGCSPKGCLVILLYHS